MTPEKTDLYFKIDELVTVSELCTTPAKYINQLAKCEISKFILTRSGKPVCAIVPLSALQNDSKR